MSFWRVSIFLCLLCFTPAQAEPRGANDPLSEAEAKYDAKQYDQARIELEAILKTAALKPDQRRRGTHLVALSYFALGDTRKAVDTWEGLFDADKSDDLAVKIAYNLGLAYTRLGQPQKAYASMAAIDAKLLRRQKPAVQRAFNELFGQTATAVDQNEKAILAFSTGLSSAQGNAASREKLLDQIALAAKKLSDSARLDALAAQVQDAEAKKRILEAKRAVVRPKDPVESLDRRPAFPRWSLRPELGVFDLSYRQTGIDNVKIMALAPGLTAKYWLGRRIALMAGGDVFVLMLKSEGTQVTTRLANAGAGFDFLVWPGKTSSFSVDLRYTYSSLLAVDSRYGFKNLTGPALGLKYFQSTGGVSGLLLTLSGAALNNDTKPVTLDSRKLSAAVAYRFRYSSKAAPLEVGVKCTNVALKFSNAAAAAGVCGVTVASDFTW